eukprot:352106_1
MRSTASDCCKEIETNDPYFCGIDELGDDAPMMEATRRMLGAIISMADNYSTICIGSFILENGDLETIAQRWLSGSRCQKPLRLPPFAGNSEIWTPMNDESVMRDEQNTNGDASFDETNDQRWQREGGH